MLERFPFEEAYGLHNMPGLSVGSFATRPGAFIAAEGNFETTLSGEGDHASCPHEGRDALVAACAAVMGLQTVVSRQIDPAHLSVLSVTELLTDGTRNATARSASILGNARSFDQLISQRIEEGLRRVAYGTGAAHGCDVQVKYTREFVPLINDAMVTNSAVEAGNGSNAPLHALSSSAAPPSETDKHNRACDATDIHDARGVDMHRCSI